MFLDVPLSECIERDKVRSLNQNSESLYQMALDGVITNMIGINGPTYEPSLNGYDGEPGRVDISA